LNLFSFEFNIFIEIYFEKLINFFKKLSMIEERIKLLEERENLYNLDMEESAKKEKKDDFLDEKEDKMIRMREINMKIRKEVERKATKFDDNQLIDKDIIIDKQSHKSNIQPMNSMNFEHKNTNSMLNIKDDPNEPKRNDSNFFNNNKFRNSVLQIKMNKTNNISVFNNVYNKDVMNEFGNKFSFDENKNEANVEKKFSSQHGENHGKSTNTNQNMTSLNKFFSQRSVDLTRPSPNKVFFFGNKK